MDGFTRSTVLMKEAGATLPGDGVPVTRTLSVFRVRYARCMRTPLLALCLHGYNIRYPSSRFALHGRSIEPRASMSRNAQTRSQLLSVYYNLTPCHARLLNVLSSMGIKIHRSQATKQGQKYKMRRFSHE